MAPSDFDDEPDILLHLDSYEAKGNENILNLLQRGQEIGFNATIINLTDEKQGLQMQGLSVWNENGVIQISAFYNKHGRYKKNQKNFLDKNT